MPTTSHTLTHAGVGLRLPYLAEVAAATSPGRWVEIHPENFLANPHAQELLVDIAARVPVSVHSVGVSIGSACGVDRRHLARVQDLVNRISPVAVSVHLAWSTHQGEYLNDLLPLPYTEESLAVLAAHVREVQDVLGRPLLVENPSSYVGIAGSTMTEVELLAELVRQTGCRLLCDVSNVHVSAHNLGYDARAYLDAFPTEAVAEFHLGGFTPEQDESARGAQVLIDTHGERIAEACWDLYAHAIRRFGPVPTLIEWDNDLPAYSTLLEEAERADAVMATARLESHVHAAR